MNNKCKDSIKSFHSTQVQIFTIIGHMKKIKRPETLCFQSFSW